MKNFSPFRGVGGLFIVIVLLGTCLRLYGITAVKNVDEPNIINRAVLIADGQWHVRWYNWPGQSLMRINAALFTDYVTFQRIINPQWRDVSIQNLYQQHRSQFTAIAHVVTVIFSCISLVFLFLIGKKMFSVEVGLLAALFLGVSYLFVTNSRFATPDVPMTAMFLVSIYASLRLLDIPFTNVKQRRWWYVLGGAAVGFAVATKYTGALAVVPLMLASILKKKFSVSSEFLSVASVILSALVIHTLFNPFALWDWRIILHDFIFEAKPTRLGADWGGANWSFFRNLWLYVSSSLQWNGTMISLMAYGTMIFSIIRDNKRWRQHLILLSFFVIMLFGLSSLGLHWSRWAVPLCPIIALYAGYGVMRLLEWIRSVGTGLDLPLRVSMMGLIVIIITPQIILSWLSGYSAKHDIKTINVLSRYIQKNIPAQSTIAADTYYLDIGTTYDLKTPKHKLYTTTLDDYRTSGVEYIVVKPKRLVAAQKQPEKYPHVIQFFSDLETQATKIYSIQPQSASLAVPTNDIEVYRWLLQNHKDAQKIKGTELELYRL